MLHEDRQRARSFGAEAERYDRARPTYPAALVDELLSGHPTEALDVGCGTGLASRLLVERGCEVLGVEPDERMAAVARRRGLRVEVASFETWQPPPRRFDLLVSGQAWHWVDPTTGADKAASVLEPGGRIGLFWNVGVLPPDLKEAIDAAYEHHGQGIDGYSLLLGNAGSERLELAAGSLRASGSFSDVEIRAFRHEIAYTTEAWLDQLPTHSDHASLGPDRLGPLLAAAVGAEIDRFGGHFTMSYDTWLVGAHRT